jgi:hypothetical protein
MAKNQNNAGKASSVDFAQIAADVTAAAKDKPGSRGNQLQRVGKFLAGGGKGVQTMREALGDEGAARIVALPRNVLAKLPKLAECIESGTEWCSLAGFDVSGSRKEDASVAVALAGLGAGTERQKAVVAAASARYPGGANAQMPAALDALCFFRIVQRPLNQSARNAEYVIVDKARADALMPRVQEVK